MSTPADCIYCGGDVKETMGRLDYRYHGQLYILENVPLAICGQCGEKYISAGVAKKIEAVVSSSSTSVKTIAIPVISIAA